jgi:hypothetical protein
MINYKQFPVVSMDEYEGVVIDVHQSILGYTPTIHFITQFPNPTAKLKSNRDVHGFGMTTHMICATLEEVYSKISQMIDIGFFNRTSVSGYGNLWNDKDEVVREIEWHTYATNIDDDDDDEDDEDITDSIFHSVSRTLH